VVADRVSGVAGGCAGTCCAATATNWFGVGVARLGIGIFGDVALDKPCLVAGLWMRPDIHDCDLVLIGSVMPPHPPRRRGVVLDVGLPDLLPESVIQVLVTVTAQSGMCGVVGQQADRFHAGKTHDAEKVFADLGLNDD
jgi:hypothetical protein